MNAHLLPMAEQARPEPASPHEATPVLDRRQRPLRDLRLSVIDACNFRCGYCMPADRVPDDYGLDAARRLDFDQIETLVRAFARQGVSKLRLTGGEPLLRRGLPALVARLAAIEGIDDIAMTTNGALLARHAAALREAGLGRVTISLDALEPALFARLTGGRGQIEDVLAGIAAADAVGLPVKLNCVIQHGVNEDQVLPLVAHFRGTGHVLRFIEYMDVGNCNRWRAGEVVRSAELRARIHARWPLRALDAQYRGEVASRHAFVDGGGEVGFVSSISEPFCGDCNRARVSADGQLYTCLFAEHGHDLKPALFQGEAALRELIGTLWQARDDRYSELRGQIHNAYESNPQGERRRVEMFLVGG